MITLLSLGSLGFNNPALASSKVVTPEALDLAISTAAQKFVDSILDDYADILEGSFDIAYDPLKSALKSVNKQVSKSTKASKKGEEGQVAPAIAVSSEPFTAAMTTFASLLEQTEGYQAQLETAPEVIEALIQTQIGAKMEVLKQAFSTVAAAVEQISEDITTLEISDPASTATFSEHSTLLTQAVDAVDTAIDSFES